MKHWKTISLFFSVFISSNVASYDESSPVTNVTYIYSPVVGTPFISFGADSMPGCYNNNGAYLEISNEVGADRTFSLLMAAYMAQKPVKVYYNLNSVQPGYTGWGLCTIESIDVR